MVERNYFLFSGSRNVLNYQALWRGNLLLTAAPAFSLQLGILLFLCLGSRLPFDDLKLPDTISRLVLHPFSFVCRSRSTDTISTCTHRIWLIFRFQISSVTARERLTHSPNRTRRPNERPICSQDKVARRKKSTLSHSTRSEFEVCATIPCQTLWSG